MPRDQPTRRPLRHRQSHMPIPIRHPLHFHPRLLLTFPLRPQRHLRPRHRIPALPIHHPRIHRRPPIPRHRPMHQRQPRHHHRQILHAILPPAEVSITTHRQHVKPGLQSPRSRHPVLVLPVIPHLRQIPRPRLRRRLPQQPPHRLFLHRLTHLHRVHPPPHRHQPEMHPTQIRRPHHHLRTARSPNVLRRRTQSLRLDLPHQIPPLRRKHRPGMLRQRPAHQRMRLPRFLVIH